MFSNNQVKKEAEEVSSSSNIIGKGTTITGNIETTANIRIEGKVVGDIRTKAKVALGDSCQIQGNVYAQNAEVAGTVTGVIEVADLLVLKSTAVIKGDIITSKLAVEPGANFNGTCKMGSGPKELNFNGTFAPKSEKAAAAV